jgi:hypothetical protein
MTEDEKTVRIPGNPDHVDRYRCDRCGQLQVVLVWDHGVTVDGNPVEDFEMDALPLMKTGGRIDQLLADVDARTCAGCG